MIDFFGQTYSCLYSEEVERWKIVYQRKEDFHQMTLNGHWKRKEKKMKHTVVFRQSMPSKHKFWKQLWIWRTSPYWFIQSYFIPLNLASLQSERDQGLLCIIGWDGIGEQTLVQLFITISVYVRYFLASFFFFFLFSWIYVCIE